MRDFAGVRPFFMHEIKARGTGQVHGHVRGRET